MAGVACFARSFGSCPWKTEPMSLLTNPPSLGDPSGLLLWAISLGLLVLKVYAFADCVRRPAEPFVAFGKLTKPIWLAITGVAALLHLLNPSVLGILTLLGTVAAIVYVTDVKPAVSGTANPW